MNKELGPIKLNDMSVEVQLKANPDDIQHITNPCLEVQLKAVEANPNVIILYRYPMFRSSIESC